MEVLGFWIWFVYLLGFWVLGFFVFLVIFYALGLTKKTWVCSWVVEGFWVLGFLFVWPYFVHCSRFVSWVFIGGLEAGYSTVWLWVKISV